MQTILDPWPWYVAGPLIAAVMTLLLLSGKTFGASSNLRTLCAICGAGAKSKFFDFDWRSQRWNLTVMLGAALGAWIAVAFLNGDAAVPLNPATVERLQTLGVDDAGHAYQPVGLFGDRVSSSPPVLATLAVGGFLIGFGTRYAGGCTSGHAITGLSQLQLPSLIAVVGFFLGGLAMTYFFLPAILRALLLPAV